MFYYGNLSPIQLGDPAGVGPQNMTWILRCQENLLWQCAFRQGRFRTYAWCWLSCESSTKSKLNAHDLTKDSSSDLSENEFDAMFLPKLTSPSGKSRSANDLLAVAASAAPGTGFRQRPVNDNGQFTTFVIDDDGGRRGGARRKELLSNNKRARSENNICRKRLSGGKRRERAPFVAAVESDDGSGYESGYVLNVRRQNHKLFRNASSASQVSNTHSTNSRPSGTSADATVAQSSSKPVTRLRTGLSRNVRSAASLSSRTSTITRPTNTPPSTTRRSAADNLHADVVTTSDEELYQLCSTTETDRPSVDNAVATARSTRQDGATSACTASSTDNHHALQFGLPMFQRVQRNRLFPSLSTTGL